MSYNFLGLEKQFCQYETSGVVVIPVPFEASVSYKKGTKKAPQAIIAASGQVELYDIDLDKEIHKVGIHTLKPLNYLSRKKLFTGLKKSTVKFLKDGKFPVYLGGEHTITIPIVEGMKQLYPEMWVLHLDAHSDLRDTYEDDPYSHACTMRRVFDLGLPFISVGVRSQDLQERQFAREHNISIYYESDFQKDDSWMEQVIEELGQTIYLTFDIDVINPSEIRSIGSPEPGGLRWEQIISFLKKLSNSQKTILGFDVVELAPAKDDHASNFICAKLIYRMIGYCVK